MDKLRNVAKNHKGSLVFVGITIALYILLTTANVHAAEIQPFSATQPLGANFQRIGEIVVKMDYLERNHAHALSIADRTRFNNAMTDAGNAWNTWNLTAQQESWAVMTAIMEINHAKQALGLPEVGSPNNIAADRQIQLLAEIRTGQTNATHLNLALSAMQIGLLITIVVALIWRR